MILKTTSRLARWGRLLFLPSSGCSRFHLPVRKYILKLLYRLVTSTVLILIAHNSYALQLSSDTKLAMAGYYQLSWKAQQENIQLQESGSASFASAKTVYTGPDRARVVSGKPDGDYYYRLLSTGNNKPVFSNIVKVTVHHHPLKTAAMFFIAGLIVFIATITLIFNGIRREA